MEQAQNVTAVPLPPGPDGLPLLGVLPGVWKDPLGFFLKAAVDYGPVARLQMGPKDFYLVSGPEEVKYVLQENHHNYRKGYDQARPLFGDGLLTSDGEEWLRRRRMIQPMFNRTRLSFFSQFMTQATEEMLDRWETLADQGIIDAAHEMMKLTQTIIVRSMFSSDVGEEAARLGAAFDDTLEYLNRILFAPHPALAELPSAATRRNRRALAYLDAFIYRLIERKRASGEDTGDLLSLLVLARGEDGQPSLTDAQVRDELMTIFLAGHETTANALAWTWYLLGLNPDVEARLVEEIDTVLGGSPPTYDDLEKLRYTPLVLHEAMRLYPPAWMFVRHAIADDELGGYCIPAGEMVMISPYVTHRLPQHWENPEAFDPERFTAERSAGRHKFAYFPFGGGPRLCIGNNFALIEAQLILVRVLQRFRLRLALVPGSRVIPTPIATLQPKPGVPIRLERRY